MKKALSEMSLIELWELFPIVLVEHKNYWKEWYIKEQKKLKKNLKNIKRISHIGSTKIPLIHAKPIIDILIEVPINSDLSKYKEQIIKCGYICMSETSNRISFNKGYTVYGFSKKVFHLHLRYYKDNDELYFRDYLIEHLDIAKEYEKLKLSLKNKFKHDRDEYTNAKTDFTSKYTNIAKELYKDRY